MRPLLLLAFVFTGLTVVQAQTFHTVNSGNFYYNPSNLVINAGDTVQWINDGGLHNVNATNSSITGASFNNPESFTSSPTDDGVLFTKVFTVAGTYEYDCSVGSHANNGMVGVVVVNSVSNTTQPEELNLLNSLSVKYLSGDNTIQLEFNLGKAANQALITMNDFSGKILSSQMINPSSGDNLHQINVNENIPSGVYFISLQVDAIIETRKLFIR